ncbi:MAG: uracil-DNA glycosylase [Alphaproteobacteria bacterium]|nr:uracil-DNA glycosylase [Alphaproteobacteria bacterium]
MSDKKHTAFLNFLSESGVSDLQTEVPIPLNTWGKAKPTPVLSHISVAKEPVSSLTFESLDDIKQALETFDKCGLKKYAKHTIVGEGITDQPLVMCIGEAPEADEDRLGRPFVGEAGQLLDKMLAAIGLSRETNTYVTNVIPWRPPGNRPPTEEEIALCKPFLMRQIELIKPKFILLLGGAPAHALTERTDGITRLRGGWLSVCDIPSLPTFHPSYLLRTPVKKKEAWADLLSLQNRIH